MKALVLAVSIGLALATAGCAQDAPREGDLPRVTRVCTVAPDVLRVEVHEGEAVFGKQIPYEAEEGDRVDDPDLHRWVRRGGELIGALAGPEGARMREFDRVVGGRLDVEWAMKPGSYSLTSTVDAKYAQGQAPVDVHRKSKPTAFARADTWQFESPVEHVLFLVLRNHLAEGAEYELSFPGGPFDAVAFTPAPPQTRSDAVHVSHLGFRPDDPAKVAFLSCWMGDGGGLTYPAGLSFSVLDDETGESVYEGQLALSKAADAADEDAYNLNHNLTDVWEADFSELSAPGTYRVCVDGVGCSYPFEIADDVWERAFRVSAKGFYHQRSGIELGPPYTDFKRPRCFHPDDGVVVYHSTCSLMDSGNGLATDDDGNFGHLVAGKTDVVVEDAWGGYMDAGDWDRRIQHLKASRMLLELAELFPERFADGDLNIPESGDGLPDIVSEALFNLDCYRRMQTAEGGIRGGIESEEHPAHGDASWQESLDIMAYAPGVWSSYEYAGVAARAAYVLEKLKPELAQVYLDSALRAMEWAEEELPGRADRDDAHAVSDSRNLAAAELYRVTGDARWHDIFIETTAFSEPGAELFVWQDHQQQDAPFVYMRTEADVDEDIQGNCQVAILREARDRVQRVQQMGFRWSKFRWRPSGAGALTAPDAVSLLRAFHLTGDPELLRAAVLACQTGAGANPLNLCYTTGLGHKSPQHPLHIDSQITGQAPPPGLTIFGPLNPEQMSQDWAEGFLDQTCYPPAREWPIIEGYFDVFWYPMMCEFTIHLPMAENAYVWGYLAARE